MKVLFLSADEFEDVELIYPLHRLKEEGHEVYVASFNRGKITGKHGYSVNVDLSFDEVDPDEFDAAATTARMQEWLDGAAVEDERGAE